MLSHVLKKKSNSLPQTLLNVERRADRCPQIASTYHRKTRLHSASPFYATDLV